MYIFYINFFSLPGEESSIVIGKLWVASKSYSAICNNNQTHTHRQMYIPSEIKKISCDRSRLDIDPKVSDRYPINVDPRVFDIWDMFNVWHKVEYYDFHLLNNFHMNITRVTRFFVLSHGRCRVLLGPPNTSFQGIYLISCFWSNSEAKKRHLTKVISLRVKQHAILANIEIEILKTEKTSKMIMQFYGSSFSSIVRVITSDMIWYD